MVAMSADLVGGVFHVRVPGLTCVVVRVLKAHPRYDSIFITQPWSLQLGRWAKSRQSYHSDFLGASADNVHCREAHGYEADR